MDCQHAQEIILESLIEPVGELQLVLDGHLAVCTNCRRFAEEQRKLDARLARAFPEVHLGSDARIALKELVRRDPVSAWPDFMPDVAHLGGCTLAIVVLVSLLPRYSGTLVLAGVAFTGVTYFLQAILRSSLDTTA